MKFANNNGQELEEGEISEEEEERIQTPSTLPGEYKSPKKSFPSSPYQEEYIIERVSIRKTQQSTPKSTIQPDNASTQATFQAANEKKKISVSSLSASYNSVSQGTSSVQASHDKSSQFIPPPPIISHPLQMYQRISPINFQTPQNWKPMRRNPHDLHTPDEQKVSKIPKYKNNQYRNYNLKKQKQKSSIYSASYHQEQKERMMREREQKIRRKNRQNQIQNIQERVIQKMSSCGLQEEENQELICLFRNAIKMEAPSEDVLDLLQNNMNRNGSRQMIYEVLDLLQGKKIIEKLQERHFLRKVVGEEKLSQAHEFYNQVRKREN